MQLVERALPCLATVTYLAAANNESLVEWIAALKPLCAPQVARSPKINRLRELRCLHLTVLEAHRLPQRLVPNPYCVIALNQVSLFLLINFQIDQFSWKFCHTSPIGSIGSIKSRSFHK